MSISFSQTGSCGKEGVAAGIEGTLSGMANIVGLGGLVSAIPGMDDEKEQQAWLSAAQSNLQKQTSKWQDAINNLKFQIGEDQNQFLQNLINTSMDQQAVINETLNEKVQTNALMISMLVALVTFLVFYDIF